MLGEIKIESSDATAPAPTPMVMGSSTLSSDPMVMGPPTPAVTPMVLEAETPTSDLTAMGPPTPAAVPMVMGPSDVPEWAHVDDLDPAIAAAANVAPREYSQTEIDAIRWACGFSKTESDTKTCLSLLNATPDWAVQLQVVAYEARSQTVAKKEDDPSTFDFFPSPKMA